MNSEAGPDIPHYTSVIKGALLNIIDAFYVFKRGVENLYDIAQEDIVHRLREYKSSPLTPDAVQYFRVNQRVENIFQIADGDFLVLGYLRQGYWFLLLFVKQAEFNKRPGCVSGFFRYIH